MMPKILKIFLLLIVVEMGANVSATENLFPNSFCKFKVQGGAPIAFYPQKDVILACGITFDDIYYAKDSFIQVNAPFVPSLSMCFDKIGNIWLANSKGVVRMDKTTHDTVRYGVADGLPPDISSGGATIKGANCRSISFDSTTNRLLVATLTGIAWVDLDASGFPKGKWNSYVVQDASVDFAMSYAGTVNGQMFASNCNDGIFHYYDGQWVVYKAVDLGVTSFSGCFWLDSWGNLWTGAVTGVFPNKAGALLRMDGITKKWEKIEVDGISTKFVNNLMVDVDSVVWINGTGSVYKINLKQNLLKISAELIKADNAWINELSLPFFQTPTGHCMMSGAGWAVVDTTGLTAHYANVGIIINHPNKIQHGIPTNAKFVGVVDLKGRMVANPSNLKMNLSSGMYFSIFQTPDGKKYFQNHLRTANPLR